MSSSYDYSGYKVSYRLNGSYITEVVYAPHASAAKDMIKSKYGGNATEITNANLVAKSQYELDLEQKGLKRKEEQDREQLNRIRQEEEKKKQEQHEKQMQQHKRKLEELEIKTLNIEYKQQAKDLKEEIISVQPNIKEWEEYKKELEDEINFIITEVREKIDKFSEYSEPLKNFINELNEKIDKHNKQTHMQDANKVDEIDSLNDTLNTEVDFTKKIDEDLGIGGWIFIILILALILYSVDWFFELNIYSSVYEFLKNLFGSKT